MIRVLGGGVLVILVVIAAGFIAQRIFGSGTDPMHEAQEAIDALPYGISMRETSEGVLVGTIQGHLGVAVHFAVADSLDARGIPSRLRRIDPEPIGGGGFWIWEDSAGGPRGQTENEVRERTTIAVSIEEALCRKTTGDACPV